MPKGGRRANAGRKPGNVVKLQPGLLALKFAAPMLRTATELIESPSLEDRKWALKELMPYVFAKTATQIAGDPDNPIKHKVTFEFRDAD